MKVYSVYLHGSEIKYYYYKPSLKELKIDFENAVEDIKLKNFEIKKIKIKKKHF